MFHIIKQVIFLSEDLSWQISQEFQSSSLQYEDKRFKSFTNLFCFLLLKFCPWKRYFNKGKLLAS